MLSYPGVGVFFNFFMHFSTSGGVKSRLSDSSLVLLKLCVKSSKPWSKSSGAKMFLKCSRKSLAFGVSSCLL